MITPLRKLKENGDLYVRTSPVLAQLQELLELDREQLLRRCAINTNSHTEYVHTECLLYFVRASKEDNSDAWFERLYKLLLNRVLKILPGGKIAPQINVDIGQKALDRFIEILSLDRQGYDERLDYFEIRFNSALASLRITANKSAFKQKKREEDLVDSDSESGEFTQEMEQAAVAFDPFAGERLDNSDYRFALEEAIDTLTPLQTRILTMLSMGYKIDPKDKDEVSICRTLNKSEKTIRLHRDKAYETLRKRLEPDAP